MTTNKSSAAQQQAAAPDIAPARATLRDVAEEAGVHVSTASRVLSGGRPVRPETERDVREAARRLNYRVDPIARALARQQTQTVGIVVPNIDNPFFPAVIRSVEQELDAQDIALILCDAQDDPQVEAKRVQTLVSGRVDALLISPVDTVASAVTVRDAARRVPVVQFDRHVNVTTDIVRVDQGRAVQLAVEHLRAEGRVRFAFVTTKATLSTLNERAAEWARLFAESPDDRSRVLNGDLTADWGARAARQLLSGDEPIPDGILCGNDIIAAGLIKELRRAGVTIGKDVAVIGFDDTPIATVIEPSLTSIRQPLEQLGAEAVQLLRRSSSQAPRQMVLTPELIIRSSSLRGAAPHFPGGLNQRPPSATEK